MGGVKNDIVFLLGQLDECQCRSPRLGTQRKNRFGRAFRRFLHQTWEYPVDPENKGSDQTRRRESCGGRGQPRPKSGSGIMGSGEAALVAYCPNAYLQMQTWPWESSWSQPSLPDTARLPGTPLLHTELPASPATWPPRALKDRTLGSCFKGTILGLSVASTQISQCLLHPETPSFAYWTGLHTC